MNEDLQRQLIKQLKLLNFWITFFGVFFVVTLVVLGFMLFQLISFMQDTADKFETLQRETRQSLDVKQKICNDSTASRLIGGAVCD